LKITRRRFLKASGSGVLASLTGLGYGTLIEPDSVSIERPKVKMRGLPAALEGLKIVALSDFHLHPFTKLPHVQKAIELANAQKPDLVVFLGDYVDATVDAIDELAPALAKLNARLGVFGVLGNHDHWKGALKVQSTLSRHGITVLRNTGLAISAGGSELFLAGTDSVWAGRPNLSAALANHRGKTPVILLAHEPDYADIATEDGRIGLQLSGHSHGGQVRVPFFGALQLPSYGRKYDQGLYQVKAMALYTNRGIGMVDIPVRINCPPEVTVLTLCGS
jgi:predicted MPP superfamily phosphohydrolase